ncbi:acyltransferase [Sphingomonas sp.]|uniref:acyltransferase family protein n=1 Tax=Sphingomonas sp. TaxID=28214 RepID=UPI0031DB47F3
MTRGSPRQRFLLIEGGRGVAALLVVLHHVGSIMAEGRFFGAQPFGGHLSNFNVGVDFFFVLSGFIITWIHQADIGHADRLGRFARRRFLRIFPPYWAILIPLLLLYLAFPNLGRDHQRQPVNILLSFLLLPNTVHPVLGVAWTLTYEIMFYAVFALIIAMGQRALWLFPIWAATIMAVAVRGVALPFPLGFVLSPYNLEFIAGVGVALVLQGHRVPAPRLVTAAGAALFLIAMLVGLHLQDDPLRGRLVFGGTACLFVLGAVEWERTRTLRLPGFWIRLGEASFAIYLIHVLAISFGTSLLIRLGARPFPLPLVGTMLAAIAVLAGLAFHLLVEPRAVALARHLLDRRRQAATVMLNNG